MWSINAVNTKQGVVNEVNAATATGGQRDQDELAAVKAFVLARLDTMPSQFNGAAVEASGHADDGAHGFHISFRPLRLVFP